MCVCVYVCECVLCVSWYVCLSGLLACISPLIPICHQQELPREPADTVVLFLCNHGDSPFGDMLCLLASLSKDVNTRRLQRLVLKSRTKQ